MNYRGAWLPHLVEVYFTETHLFVLNRSYLIHGYIGNVEVIQTFALPNDDPDPDPSPRTTRDSVPDGNADPTGDRPIVRELRLTHEILSRDTGSLWLTPMRNSTVDPITNSTTLRFMHAYAPFQPTRESRARLVCTDYILPALPRPDSPRPPSADKNRHVNRNTPNNNRNNNDDNRLGVILHSTEPVLPITVVSHEVLSVHGVWHGNLVDVSHDGFVRGLCMVGRYAEGSNIPNVGTVYKFSVDATGERCDAIVGDPCPPWEGLNTSRHYEYTFDAVKGRLWHTKWDVVEMDRNGQPVDREVLAIVADFK